MAGRSAVDVAFRALGDWNFGLAVGFNKNSRSVLSAWREYVQG